jgi:hypothetical protein
VALYNIIGVSGVAMVLAAYAGVQAGMLHEHRAPFSVINLLGAALILFSLAYDFNLPSLVIQLAWMLISAHGLWKALRQG